MKKPKPYSWTKLTADMTICRLRWAGKWSPASTLAAREEAAQRFRKEHANELRELASRQALDKAVRAANPNHLKFTTMGALTLEVDSQSGRGDEDFSVYRYWYPSRGHGPKKMECSGLQPALDHIADMMKNVFVTELHLCTGITGWRMFSLVRRLDGDAMDKHTKGPPVFFYGPATWELDVSEFHGDESTQSDIVAFFRTRRGVLFYEAD